MGVTVILNATRWGVGSMVGVGLGLVWGLRLGSGLWLWLGLGLGLLVVIIPYQKVGNICQVDRLHGDLYYPPYLQSGYS